MVVNNSSVEETFSAVTSFNVFKEESQLTFLVDVFREWEEESECWMDMLDQEWWWVELVWVAWESFKVVLESWEVHNVLEVAEMLFNVFKVQSLHIFYLEARPSKEENLDKELL